MATKKKKSGGRPKAVPFHTKVNEKWWDSHIDYCDTAEDKEYWNGIHDYIPVEPEQAEEFDIVDPNELITRRATITVKYEYPLNGEFELSFKHKGGFTRKQLFKAIQTGYVRIYREEDAAEARNDVETPYGIWGHNIGDLVIEGIKIDGQGRVTLSIGS